MHVFLLRHGIAEDPKPGMDDSNRALTAEGKRKLKQVLAKAADAGVKPDVILSSPLKRAMETASIAAGILGYQESIVKTNALMPGGSPEGAWEAVREHRDTQSVLLTGHNPLFQYLAAFLLGSPDTHVDFKKGALMRVDVERLSAHPKGVLCWYLTAKLAE